MLRKYLAASNQAKINQAESLFIYLFTIWSTDLLFEICEESEPV